MAIKRIRLDPPIKRERLHEPIKRERLPERIIRVKMEDLPSPRPRRQPRGPNKARFITDNRRLISRRDVADAYGISVDKVKQMQAKTPNDTGLQPIRLPPKGRKVFYDIDVVERYLKVALRPRQSANVRGEASAAPPSSP